MAETVNQKVFRRLASSIESYLSNITLKTESFFERGYWIIFSDAGQKSFHIVIKEDPECQYGSSSWYVSLCEVPYLESGDDGGVPAELTEVRFNSPILMFKYLLNNIPRNEYENTVSKIRGSLDYGDSDDPVCNTLDIMFINNDK
jgi:hypothetical protein